MSGNPLQFRWPRCSRWIAALGCTIGTVASAQLTDVTQAPNTVDAGIKKSLSEQVGAGRGDIFTPGSSAYLIARDPARAIRRGRQLFQRKFTASQGLGPRTGDGVGAIEAELSIGAGLADSCAACHGRPFGSAGFGGNVFTRPNSRDAPHLFGLGLKEMLADEITADLRQARGQALAQAQQSGLPVVAVLASKGIDFGSLTALPDGTVDTSGVDGVDLDLRVRPFFHHGETVSMREFIVGAFNAEMGLEAPDPDLVAASAGADVTTPSGMALTGSVDVLEAPPVDTIFDDSDFDGITNEIDTAVVDLVEFYLLNYFKPAVGRQFSAELRGEQLFDSIGCTDCHMRNLEIDVDRRVADVETRYDAAQSNGVFNDLFASAALQFTPVDDGQGFPPLAVPNGQPFLVENIYTDFKRHDLGPAFHEIHFDGSKVTEHLTTPLWGVGSTSPYGHDGRSADLVAVILRHGGEAASQTAAYQALKPFQKRQIVAFLSSLVLFSPEDTASSLDMADPSHPNFPFDGKGSISLVPLFVDPTDPE